MKIVFHKLTSIYSSLFLYHTTRVIWSKHLGIFITDCTIDRLALCDEKDLKHFWFWICTYNLYSIWTVKFRSPTSEVNKISLMKLRPAIIHKTFWHIQIFADCIYNKLEILTELRPPGCSPTLVYQPSLSQAESSAQSNNHQGHTTQRTKVINIKIDLYYQKNYCKQTKQTKLAYNKK